MDTHDDKTMNQLLTSRWIETPGTVVDEVDQVRHVAVGRASL
jgi:hypothetical protein